MFDPLQGSCEAQYCIVGAGYTGLSAAIRLAQAGCSVVVLEAHEPGFGASGRNTGWWLPMWLFATPTSLAERLGASRAAALASFMIDAGALVPQLIRRYQIACDLSARGVLLLARTAATAMKLARLGEDWNRHGGKMRTIERSQLDQYVHSSRYVGGLLVEQAGQLNPLAFCRGLARAAVTEGAKIHARSPAIALARRNGAIELSTPQGRVHAQQVLLATDAFLTAFAALERSFLSLQVGMIASAPLPQGGAPYLPGGVPFSDMDSGDTFAVGFSRDGRLVTSILPGWRSDCPPSTAAKPFWRAFKRTFPHAPAQVQWEYAWSGRLGVPKDRFLKLYELAPGCLACLGYSGNGITQATMAGQEVAELMLSGDAERCRLALSECVPLRWASATSGVLNRAVLPALGTLLYR